MTTPVPSRSGVPPPDRLGVPLPDRPGLRLAGSDVLSPLVTGELRPYVNFDYAASAPPLQAVESEGGLWSTAITTTALTTGAPPIQAAALTCARPSAAVNATSPA